MPGLCMEKGRDLLRTSPKACLLRGQQAGALLAQLFQGIQGKSKPSMELKKAMTSNFFLLYTI